MKTIRAFYIFSFLTISALSFAAEKPNCGATLSREQLLSELNRVLGEGKFETSKANFELVVSNTRPPVLSIKTTFHNPGNEEKVKDLAIGTLHIRIQAKVNAEGALTALRVRTWRHHGIFTLWMWRKIYDLYYRG